MSGLKSVDILKLRIYPDAVSMFSYSYAFSKRFMPIKIVTYAGMSGVKIAVPDDLEPGELENMLETIRDNKGFVLLPVSAKVEQINALLKDYENVFS